METFKLYNLNEKFVLTSDVILVDDKLLNLEICKKGCQIKRSARTLQGNYLLLDPLVTYGIIGIVNIKGSLHLIVITDRNQITEDIYQINKVEILSFNN